MDFLKDDKIIYMYSALKSESAVFLFIYLFAHIFPQQLAWGILSPESVFKSFGLVLSCYLGPVIAVDDPFEMATLS